MCRYHTLNHYANLKAVVQSIILNSYSTREAMLDMFIQDYSNWSQYLKTCRRDENMIVHAGTPLRLVKQNAHSSLMPMLETLRPNQKSHIAAVERSTQQR
jgi:hypothetical protein